jgi:hypothetical protein
MVFSTRATRGARAQGLCSGALPLCSARSLALATSVLNLQATISAHQHVQTRRQAPRASGAARVRRPRP